ncbi:MAG: hypothetical protein CL678_05345 [Bdellovibrionaceae bacterium]|nr:hypothetical protein [Pseudobdellovibrionaceae bacterium]|tara:strand:+ start:315 stop:1526 length:1212 start_codon:yes stop_codon:yes gene_type:complete
MSLLQKQLKKCFKATGVISLLLLMSCSGRNIHSEAKNDPKVLIREWTIQTHGLRNAGDHGNEYSSSALFENTLIFGTQGSGLVSLYPKINQTRWILPIPGGVVSPVAVFGRSVYFGGGDGFFYSVNAETGRVQWRYELRNVTVSRPTVSQGRVLFTTAHDAVYALDAGSGEWIWHYKRQNISTATIRGAAAPLVLGNDVITGLSDGYLVVLSLEEGALKWEKKIHQGRKFTDVDASPVYENGILYVSSYDGALYALNRKSGSTLWRFNAGGARAVQISGNRIFFPSTDGHLYCLDKIKGKVLWKFELDRGTPTEVIATPKHLFFGSSFQYLYGLDQSTGKLVYRWNVGYGSGFTAGLTWDPKNHRIYVLSGSGNLYAFRIREELRQRSHGRTDGYLNQDPLFP